MADMFEKTTTLCQKPKKAAKLADRRGKPFCSRKKGQDAESLWFSPMHLAQLIDLVDAGTINNNTAKEVFTAIFRARCRFRPPMSKHTDLAWSMTTVPWNRQFPKYSPQTRDGGSVQERKDKGTWISGWSGDESDEGIGKSG